MDTILGIILGALLGGAGKIFLDLYQRKQERRVVAAAIAGEISGILHNAAVKGLVPYFQALSAQLKGPSPPPPPWMFYDPTWEEAIIFKAHINRLGALGATLTLRVTKWYSVHQAVILQSKILASGVYNGDPHKAAAHIDGGLALWDMVERDAPQLIDDLMNLAGDA